MNLRTRLGAIVHDWPRYELALRGWGAYRKLNRPWIAMRNRDERLSIDGRGARCEWRFTTDLHITKVFPSTSARLMRRAFSDWPIALRDAPEHSSSPDVSFVIGHRGLSRLPHLLATLRSLAGQRDAAVECIVVEQSSEREIETLLPRWVRYVHTSIPSAGYDYNRSWTLNVGARLARGTVLVLHDNDMLCPTGYAAEALQRVREGSSFLELKRFTFYLGEEDTAAFFSSGELSMQRQCRIVQNLQGASVVVARDAFLDIGGFDESFVGWGGEDNEFWERAEARGLVYAFGYLPFIHLWHAPQSGKLIGNAAPGLQRYQALLSIPAETRIERLRTMEWGNPLQPATHLPAD
ncbi:MAG: galactosyltransferase-related protein [Acidobacteriota bacterium]|nr:galactosyltransferase-related protein [Acidobacteriota bacterium]